MTEKQTESLERSLALIDASYVYDPRSKLPMGASAAGLKLLQRNGNLYASSKAFPERFHGDAPTCAVILEIAIAMGVPVITVANNLFFVHGQAAFYAQFAIGRLVASGRIKGTIRYVFSGEGNNYGCHAVVIDAETGVEVEGPRVTKQVVIDEGWMKNPKWKTMPDLMFRYRAAAWLIRTSYPDVMMGAVTREELEDRGVIDVESKPIKEPDRLADTREQLMGQLEKFRAQRVAAEEAVAVEDATPEPAPEVERGPEPKVPKILAGYKAALKKCANEAEAKELHRSMVDSNAEIGPEDALAALDYLKWAWPTISV